MFKICKEHQPNQTGKYRTKGRHMPFLTQQMHSLRHFIKHLKPQSYLVCEKHTNLQF